jgi:predicted nucleotidyltransferase
MHVGRPHSAIVPSLDGDVLITLGSTLEPLTGRQVAERASRGSQSAVAVALDRLVAQGIVLRQEVGRAYLHTLNREHIAAPIVQQLAGLQTELIRRIRSRIADWPIQPLHASFFGSAARADGRVDSDIDLLIVSPEGSGDEDEAWCGQVHQLSESVLAWTGNYAGIIELSADSLALYRNDPPPIVTDLHRDAYELAGISLREALGPPSSDDEPSSEPDGTVRSSRRARTTVRRPSAA